MQSHLEAALLGHNSTLSSSANHEDDETAFQDDETEEIEDFIDEECEGESNQKGKQCSSSSSRTVTLQMLLSAGILRPGSGTMTIEYLGQKFVGDLLDDGKIRSQETDIVFASPSAWAIACKRFINPDKKSGCGWASVKYCGKKLDAYKNVWYKKKNQDQKPEKAEMEMELLNQRNMANSVPYQRIVVKHNTIANRTLTHDANTLIECVPFSNLGKIQPFLVTLSTNAALLMDFHCHLMKTEVSGYLAGHWDLNTHNLQVTHAFPCRNTKADRENAHQVELEISKAIEKEKLTLVGWYHSHPYAPAAPTLRDVDAQLDYQIRMKGTSDNSYTPCIGIIISPYNYESNSFESSIIGYWVVPPPEAKPNEYGRPMLMSYSVIQDSLVSPHIKEEMIKCTEYYKNSKDFFVNFNERYIGTTTYIDKLKSTLISKFPRDESETVLWKFIRELLGCAAEETETLLSIPSVSKPSQLIPGLNTPTPTSLSSSLMMPTDISSLLFKTGKFPSASSLLGLPDPMAHSTLAANNMFLSTNLFKMQELLKPLSTSSPMSSSSSSSTTKSKSDHKNSSPLKIPSDIKSSMKCDYASDLRPLQYMCDYPPDTRYLDLNLSKISTSKADVSETCTLSSSKSKHDYYKPDFASLSKSAMDYSLDLSKSMSDLSKLSELSKSMADYSRIYTDGEKPAKIPKTEYSSLDLSISSKPSATVSESYSEFPTNLTVSVSNSEKRASEEKPLNLTAD